MRLAVFSRNPATAFSETFIRMQMDRLPCVLRVYGGPVGAETIPGGITSCVRSPKGALEAVFHLCAKRRQWLEGLQSAELARRFKRHKVDAVLANYGPAAVKISSLCKQTNTPLVVHFHGYDAHVTKVLESNAESYRNLAKHAAAVVAVSVKMKDQLIRLGFCEKLVHLTRCGVDPGQFVKKIQYSGPPFFVSVGRFVDKKAPYLTLLAFKKIYEQVPEARLVIVGDGFLFETTRNLVEALQLHNAVDLPGVLKPEAIAELLQRATAFLQHSIVPLSGLARGDSEGTPVALLEAMLTGVPVIVTRHAGMGEVVQDGISGLLVEERDVNGMAEAMLKVVKNPELAQNLGAAARAYVLSHHTAEHYIEDLKRIVAQAIDRFRAAEV